jgi:DNA mismatch repair protein MutL
VARLAARRSGGHGTGPSDEALLRLVRDLMACENPHTSPSGKPTYLSAGWAELQRRFGDA